MPGHVQHQVETVVLIEMNRRADAVKLLVACHFTHMSKLSQSTCPLRPVAVWLFEQMHVHF